MNVSELMHPMTDSVEVTSTVAEAARLMRDAGTACLVVMTGGDVGGIISESDMVLGCMADGHIPWQCSVGRHMSRQRQTITPDTHIGDASIMIIDGELDYVPVVADGTLAGILTSESIFGVIDSEMAYSTV